MSEEQCPHCTYNHTGLCELSMGYCKDGETVPLNLWRHCKGCTEANYAPCCKYKKDKSDEPVNIMNSDDFRQYCLDTGSYWLYYIPEAGWEKAWIQLKYAQTHFVRGYYETGTYPPDPSRRTGNVWLIFRQGEPAQYRDYDVKEDPEGYLNRCHCYSPDVLTYASKYTPEMCITCQTRHPDRPTALSPKQIERLTSEALRMQESCDEIIGVIE